MRDESDHHQHVDAGTPPSSAAAEWDAFYDPDGEGRSRWSGQPNGGLVAEVADLAPGTALDVGCGEGADAIWLAGQGWRVTGLDPSAVALRRAEHAAAEHDVTVRWLHGGLLETAAELDVFDLVSVQYGVLPRDPEATAIRVLCDAVAPGGTLLVVHHELDPAHPDHGGFDPADHLVPDEVATHLGEGWELQTHERRQRAGVLPPQARHTRDIVLRARRLGGTPTA